MKLPPVLPDFNLSSWTNRLKKTLAVMMEGAHGTSSLYDERKRG